MRRIFVFFSILLIFVVISHGQENRGPLPVSSSLIAVKITDPDTQITNLMPMVQLVDKMAANNPKAPKGVSISKSLAFLSGMLKGVPGIKSDGTFWILVMPPQYSQKNPEGLSTAVNDNGTPTFLVFPLSDPDVFQKFLDSETTKANKDMPRGMVYGDYALLGFEGVVPAFSQVDFDLLPISRRDLVVMLQWQNYELANNALKSMDIPSFSELMPKGMQNTPLGMKMGDFMQKYETSILRMEFGINMSNNVLDVEMLNLPIVGSQLEEDLAKYNTSTAKQLLRYMPATVMYAAAGGPLVESSPGTGYQVNKFVIDTMKKKIGNEAESSLPKTFVTMIQAYEEISRRCINGRAIAWVPTLVKKDSIQGNFPTFVGVYQTSSINKDLRDESRALIRKMFDSIFPAEKDEKGKIKFNTDNAREIRARYPGITLDFSAVTFPSLEKYGTTDVDVIKVVTLNKPFASKTFQTEDKIVKVTTKSESILEFRFAYIGDKLLMTIGGPESKLQMANLISRINGKLAGLSASPRFIAQTQNLRGNVRSVEVISLRDFATTAINFIDGMNDEDLRNAKKGIPLALRSGQVKLSVQDKAIIKFQRSYPSLSTYNVTVQDANDGCERFIYRIPLEQLRYIVSTVSNVNNPQIPVAKPVAKPKAPVKKTTRKKR
ncbi:MAG: hypothetical protein WCO98_04715 [bacterium]